MSGTEIRADSPEWHLCGVLTSGHYFEDVSHIVRPADFVDPTARKVFQEIEERARQGRPYDAVMLAESLPQDYGRAVLTMAHEEQGSSLSTAREYAFMVQRGARRRLVRDTLDEGLQRIENGEDIDHLAEEVALRIDSSFSGRGTTPKLPDLLKQSAEAIQTSYQMRKDHGFVGASFTLPEVDARLGGLFGTMLVVLAARTSVGKSTWGWQIAIEAAKNGSHVGIIDTEQGEVRCGIRLMSYYYRLNNTKLRIGIEDEVRKLTECADKDPILDLPLYVQCQETDLYSILGQIGRWKREHDIQFAVVDYCQKIRVPGAETMKSTVDTVTFELQRLSQRLGIPIILLSQFNRGIEKDNRPPQLSDLRESGNIEQDADLVLALHGKLDADYEGNRDVEVHVLKAKDARTGKVPYQFIMHGATYHIEQGIPL